jgi:predicted nucleotidyltransferase
MTRKCPIQEIARRAGEAGIPFLVIGGFAVIAHGYVRTTNDLDLITERGQRARSGKLLADMGMSVKNDAANFAQFTSQNESGMDVDLMFVSEAVFNQLKLTAVEKDVGGVSVHVVSLLHLIALKCHAIQNSESRLRGIKDTDDLVHLILLNGLDLKNPELRAIILKHGSEELYEKLRHACAE